ncbi:MAG: sigma-54 dependent transcriptional regulator [Planctomycetota bacterium]
MTTEPSGATAVERRARVSRNVLLIEDDLTLRESLAEYLAGKGYQVDVASDGAQGLAKLDHDTMAVVTDLKLPGFSGMDVLRRVKDSSPDTEVVIATGYGTIDLAVAAMREGAYHFVPKPINPVALVRLLDEIAEKRSLKAEVNSLRRQLDERYGFENLIGRSPKMQDVFEVIRQVAPTKATVLICGESGTGKELVARAIHQNSPRKDRPFVAINCAALPATLIESELFGHEKGAFTGATSRREGLLKASDGGTLLVDEVSELDPALQVKLLRVLETRSYIPLGSNLEKKLDLRILAATNKDLEELVRQGKFREDLLYRLKVVKILLPPLRDRREDIPILARSFLEQAVKEHGLPDKTLSNGAVVRLATHPWPGNVRELKNTIESMAVLSRAPEINEVDLDRTLGRAGEGDETSILQVGMTMEELEKRAILETLRSVNGNRTKASKILKISLRTLQRKIKEYGLQG